MNSSNDNFDNHISHINYAKKHASKLLSEFSPATETAMASLAYAWELLFDAICQNKSTSLDDLKDISAVIQKLSASHEKIQSIESSHVLDMIAEERKELSKDREQLHQQKLPAEIVQAVEEQLMLL